MIKGFSVLGKKYGKLMREIASAVKLFTDDDVLAFIENKQILLSLSTEEITLISEDLIIKAEDLPGFLTAKNDQVLVSLNTSISKELLGEGFAREFVNCVQGMRKSLGLIVTDTICVCLFGEKEALDIVMEHRAYIEGEVLAKSIVLADDKPKSSTAFEFNNYKMYIAIQE